MRRKDPLTVNNYFKTPSAWIICRAIRAGLSLNSILRGQPKIIPASSGFGPLSVHSGLPKKHLHTMWLDLIGKNYMQNLRRGRNHLSLFLQLHLRSTVKTLTYNLGSRGHLFPFRTLKICCLFLSFFFSFCFGLFSLKTQQVISGILVTPWYNVKTTFSNCTCSLFQNSGSSALLFTVARVNLDGYNQKLIKDQTTT